MRLAYSSALPNKPSFWTVSTSVNIWVFALKLFVCDNAINILNRAKVWPWDGRILTNLVIFIEIEPSEDMTYHFSQNVLFWFWVRCWFMSIKNLNVPHLLMSPSHRSQVGVGELRKIQRRQHTGRTAAFCCLTDPPSFPFWDSWVTVSGSKSHSFLLHCSGVKKEEEGTANGFHFWAIFLGAVRKLSQ